MNTPTRPDRLYAANVGLAGKVLSRFPSLTGEAREEAYGTALLGLWQAAGRFDPARGFTFATFACDYIRGHILRHLTRQRRQNRLPTVSLETPVGGNGFGDGGAALADMIADPQAERPGAALVSRSGFDALLSGLLGRQQCVLRALYQEDKPLSAVAVEMGVSKQRAGQLHLQALANLRKGSRLRQSGTFGQSGASDSV